MENPHKILEAYGAPKDLGGAGKTIIVGLSAIVIATIFDSTPLAIGGGSLIGVAALDETTSYMRAYFSAKLDHLTVGEYTQLKD